MPPYFPPGRSPRGVVVPGSNAGSVFDPLGTQVSLGASLPPAPRMPAASTTLPAASTPTRQLSGYQGVQGQYNAPQAQQYYGIAGAPAIPQQSLGSTLPPQYGAVPGITGVYYQPSYAAGMWNSLPQAQGGGGGYDIPYGVDPVWWAQFTKEHDGQTPEQVYRRDGEYAVAHALSDKAWGEQFYRTYGRPPSEYDWKASYYQRQNAFYGG